MTVAAAVVRAIAKMPPKQRHRAVRRLLFLRQSVEPTTVEEAQAAYFKTLDETLTPDGAQRLGAAIREALWGRRWTSR